MKRRHLYGISLAIALFSNIIFQAVSLAKPQKPCSASDLVFYIDNKESYFTGMSHSGVLLALHNTSSKACTIPARAILDFEDTSHHPLPISLQTTMGLNPGPVILPLTLPAGAWAISQMRWVSSEVYDKSVCLSPAFITIAIGHEILRTPFRGTLCGSAEKNPSYTLTFFRLDPTYIHK